MNRVYIEFYDRLPETFQNVKRVWVKDGFLNVVYLTDSLKDYQESYELERVTEFWVA